MLSGGNNKHCEAQPLTTGFRRTSRNAAYAVTVSLILFVALVAHAVLTNTSRRAAAQKGTLCALALEPGPNGEMRQSIDRLRTGFDGLVAVGLLDATGRLNSLRPEHPGYRTAIATALDAGNGPVKTGARVAGRHVTLWSQVVPLNGDLSRQSRRAVLLLDRDPYPWDSPGTIMLVAGLLAIIVCSGFRYVSIWFDQRVSGPLQAMIRFAETPSLVNDREPDKNAGGWVETGTLSDRIKDLCKKLVISEERADRLEQQAQRDLEDRQRGFDRQLRRVEDKAMVDPLTRTRNRAYLERELEAMFQAHVARKRDLAIAMMDIDDFKLHNDTYGHGAGDDVLRFVGDLLRSAVRPSDTVVRYGGDEFVLILPGVTSQQATAIVDRMVKLFGQYVATLSHASSISLSAGVASIHEDPCSSGAELLRRADEALYIAKRSGKNQVATASA